MMYPADLEQYFFLKVAVVVLAMVVVLWAYSEYQKSGSHHRTGRISRNKNIKSSKKKKN